MTKKEIQSSEELKEAIDVVNNIMKTEKPYLFTLEEELAKLENGTLTFTVRKYHGRITDLVVTETSKRSVYKQ